MKKSNFFELFFQEAAMHSRAQGWVAKIYLLRLQTILTLIVISISTFFEPWDRAKLPYKKTKCIAA